MATYHEHEQRTSAPSTGHRGRWLVIAAVLIAIAIAVVLLLTYTGGGGGTGGGGY